MSDYARAIALRSAVMSMTMRYGEATRQHAYAVADGKPDGEQQRAYRAARRRFAALQRLTYALADVAMGGAR